MAKCEGVVKFAGSCSQLCDTPPWTSRKKQGAYLRGSRLLFQPFIPQVSAGAKSVEGGRCQFRRSPSFFHFPAVVEEPELDTYIDYPVGTPVGSYKVT